MKNSKIVFGLWPVAGVTTVGVTVADAESTMAAAIEAGITEFDTAFSYGYDGESDRLLGKFVAPDRDRFRIIGKVGQRYDSERHRVIDGSPETLTADAEASLLRMGVECVDVLMLHCVDPNIPVERSAEAMATLKRRGLCKETGVCNVTPEQRRRFAGAAECQAIQCPLNLLQQDSLAELIPDCAANNCGVYVFWSLMKGLLAGKITRDHVFAEGDSRPGYPIFQGEARERAHRVVDGLQLIGNDAGFTVAQLSIGWAMSQPGVTGVLVGARRPEQIQETAASKCLSEEILGKINALII